MNLLVKKVNLQRQIIIAANKKEHLKSSLPILFCDIDNTTELLYFTFSLTGNPLQ